MDQKPKIELEELLKLKQFEKPEPEFWEKFDQGLRRKSMEALVKEDVSFWKRLMERKGLQQVSVAAALVFCTVPTYLGVQSYYAENQASESTLQVVATVARDDASSDYQQVAATSRELALKKQKADNMRFVMDQYAVEPNTFNFDEKVLSGGEATWRELNRTYINDSVKMMPGANEALPVSFIH